MITLYEGKVLDGWNRYKACLIAGVIPSTRELTEADPVAFVRSMNAHRRHLSASQRALAESQLAGWKTVGRPSYAASDNEVDGNGGKIPLFSTNAEMAERANVDVKTIKHAKTVLQHGSDELKEAVKEGEVRVDVAAKIAKLPKSEQAVAIHTKPAPKAKPEPAEDFGDNDFEKEFIRVSGELSKAYTLIEALQKNDLAKEVAKWALKFDQLEGRLQLAITQKNEADKDAKYAQGYLTKIRKELGVEKNSEIIDAIQDLKR
jgi:hypothetical protein